ncbi:MAG: hypothetical protein CEO22_234 [Candidatus Berkelbacteria bacterium Gr01-1014_85]|uniref:Glycosyltransferase n=1 Tax=Candidatus Berkelbacteria bacterium Gr01-1014_85 TaxID=2017150 RepID=A0A554JCH0_9BACT|nr:MAG: hypothetical protein CEO22_234 [Candidatus Berkelbacteria bacterium Gr01-1014_85]
MQNITFVIQRYLPAQLTGSETVIARYAECLARSKEFKVTVITSDTAVVRGIYDPRIVKLPRTESINEVSIKRLVVNWAIGSLYYLVDRFWPRLAKILGPEFKFLSFGPHFMGLEQAILESKPDFIHTGPMPLAHVWETAKIAQKHRIKLIISPMMHFGIESFTNSLIARVLNQAYKVACFTNYELTELIKMGIEPTKLTVVPASYLSSTELTETPAETFLAKYPALRDKPYLLFLGTKAFDKGLLTLLNAMPIIRQRIPNCTLVAAGLATIAWQQQSLPDYVLNLDYLEGELKRSAIAGARALVVPSRTESFGIVTLEAMGQGTPVIVGPTGASSELIQANKRNQAGYVLGKAGIAVPFNQTEVLARASTEIVINSNLAQQFRVNGLEIAKNYSLAKFMPVLIKLYSSQD